MIEFEGGFAIFIATLKGIAHIYHETLSLFLNFKVLLLYNKFVQICQKFIRGD